MMILGMGQGNGTSPQLVTYGSDIFFVLVPGSEATLGHYQMDERVELGFL